MHQNELTYVPDEKPFSSVVCTWCSLVSMTVELVSVTCLSDFSQWRWSCLSGGNVDISQCTSQDNIQLCFRCFENAFYPETSVEPRDWSSLILTCACLLHSARWAPKDTWPLSCWQRRWTHHSSTPSSVSMSMLLVLWSGRWPGGLVVSQTVDVIFSFCLFFLFLSFYEYL